MAAVAVGSLKENEFDIRFNPDVYSPGIRHCEDLDPSLNKQRQLVKEAAEFLLTVQIPTFVSKLKSFLIIYQKLNDSRYLFHSKLLKFLFIEKQSYNNYIFNVYT